MKNRTEPPGLLPEKVVELRRKTRQSEKPEADGRNAQSRKKMLVESEKRFRTLYRFMKEMVVFHEIVTDSSGTPIDYRILDCNPAFSEVTGIPYENAAGKLASELYGAGSPPFLEKYARVVEKGESFSFETEFPPMGKWFSISVVVPEKGHFATITTDITEQHDLNMALQEREKSHRQLFETMTQGVIYYTVSGEIISANPAAERILGLSLERMMGKTFMNPAWKVLREDGSELPVDEHPFRVALRAGKAVHGFVMGLSMPHRDTPIWLSVTEIPLFQPGETVPFQIYSIFDDITKEREMHAALIESEFKYRTVVESSLVGVFIAQDGMFRFVNARWCEMYGYTADEIVDKMDPFDLIHPEDRNRVREMVKLRRSGGTAWTEHESRSIRKDGKVITLKILASDGFYRGRPASLGTVIDLTEHRGSEEALSVSQAQLSEAMDLAHIVYWEFDPGTETFTFNDPFYALYGTTAEQVGGYCMSR